ELRSLPAEKDDAIDEELAAGRLLLSNPSTRHQECALTPGRFTLVRFTDALVGIREHRRFDSPGRVSKCEPAIFSLFLVVRTRRLVTIAPTLAGALSVQSDFALTQRTAPIVTAICAQFEGMPLAIELAAAWVRVLGLQQIQERLGN